jgi:hypothetical protein
VYARPPRKTGELIDLRAALERRLEIDGAHAGHFTLEDERGVRVAELHSAPGQAVQLVRPAPSGLYYLRRARDDHEFVIEAAPDVIALASLEPRPLRDGARGAASLAFGELFSLPFDARAVERYAFRPPSPPPSINWPDAHRASPARKRRVWAAVATLGSGVLVAGAALGLTLESSAIMNGVGPSTSEAAAAQKSDQARAFQTSGGVLFGVAGAAAIAGVTLLLWPDRPAPISVAASPSGAFLSARFDF